MVKVNVSKQSNYPVKTPVIKKRLSDFFLSQGIVSDAEVSVALVGENKMLEIGKRYYKKDPTSHKLHNVFSFTPSESKGFVYPPDGLLHLGEIIVCYPVALKEAKMENVLIDDKVCELVEHGALHLLGIHHKE